MKIRTKTQLISALDNDFGWRIQEISSLKRAAAKASEDNASTLLRASLPITYAHWEGFVKVSATLYTTFVSGQVSRAGELKSCFLGLMLKTSIESIDQTRRSFKLWHEGFSIFENIIHEKPSLNLRSRIDRIGNLNFDTFEEILHVCGLDSRTYFTRKNFIDEVLVQNRNYIAHGEKHFPPSGQVTQAADMCVSLLRDFKTDIENNAVQKLYLR